MNWTIMVALLIAWIYVLSIFKRKELSFFYFITGGVGFFVFTFVILEPIATIPLARFVCFLTGLIGEATGIFKAYSSYGILFIENVVGGPVSLYIDFECAGLVELLVFMSLLLFFPAYRWFEKLWVGAVGMASIMGANVLRLTAICIMIYVGGNEVYYLAHTIVGRLLFYLLAIMIYFYVFTRRQIKQQRVGEFTYNDKVD